MAALVALYQTAGGDAWKSNGNWLSEAHIGEWHGVTTDSGGFVTGLDLRSNRLSGGLPTELGSLTNLARLYLGGSNQLEGCVPRGLQDVPEGDVDSIGLPFCQVAATSDLDRVALGALYEATEGESWAMNANWLSDAPIGEWHGVTVDHSGRVTELDLRRNQLS